MQTHIIGLGHRARNGKDTAATAIIKTFKHKYYIKRYALAEALKVEVYDAIRDGKLPQGAPVWKAATTVFTPDYTIPQQKIAFVDEHKASLRALLQWWGTEYRRAMYSNYWVDLLDQRVRTEAPQIAIVTDIRFRNEMGWVRGRDGWVVKVVRDGYDGEATTLDHSSEQELDGVEFDADIHAGTVADLERVACDMFREQCLKWGLHA